MVFTQIVLKEPKKEDIVNNVSVPRIAQVLLYQPSINKTTEALVNLSSCKVTFNHLENVMPAMNFSFGPDVQFPPDQMVALLSTNQDFKKALKKRNIPLSTLGVTLQPFYELFEEPVTEEHDFIKGCSELIEYPPKKGRMVQVVFYTCCNTDPNPNLGLFDWIQGLIVLVDITHQKVVKVIDEFVGPTLPKPSPNYPLTISSATHTPLNPLCTTMPDGPSFNIRGMVDGQLPDGLTDDHEVTWDNWKFRIAWHPYTGVQLHQITYKDSTVGNQDRSVLYKASLTGALVSYDVEDPIPLRNFISTDSWSYPMLGAARPNNFTQPVRLFPLRRGLDTPDYATILSIPNLDTNGDPVIMKDLVAIYEQDGDVSWRARSLDTSLPYGGSMGSRGRQLVVKSQFAGIIYLWSFYWIFNQDGSIEVRVDVGGQTFYTVVPENVKGTKWGELISKQIVSLNHTHIYNYRFDFDIDGQSNTAIETNHKAAGRSENTCQNGVLIEDTVLKSELHAQRDIKPENNRVWSIINENVTNGLGQPTGYTIMPSANAFQLARDDSWIKTHLGFVKHHLFITKYHDDEQFAAGNYPIQQLEDVGLGKYIKDDENIVNKDIVAWYTLMFSHAPSTQDTPLIDNHTVSVRLVPDTFFTQNAGMIRDRNGNFLPQCLCQCSDEGCDNCHQDGDCNYCLPQPQDGPSNAAVSCIEDCVGIK